MSKNRFIYLMSALVSASAWGSSFQDLDQSLLKDYFNQNSLSSGLSCQLSDEKILASYQHSSIPSSYADCFILDKSDAANPKYIIKTSCASPDLINGRIKVAANNLCPTFVAGSGSGGSGGSSGSGSKSSSGRAAKNGLNPAQTAAAFIPVIAAAENVDKAFKGAKNESSSIATVASPSGPSPVKNTSPAASSAPASTSVSSPATTSSNVPTSSSPTTSSAATPTVAASEPKVTTSSFDDGSSIKTVVFPDKSQQTITTNSDDVMTHMQVADANGNTVYQGKDAAAAVAEGKAAQDSLRQSSPEMANAGDAALSTAAVAADPAALESLKTDGAEIQAFTTKSNTIINSANSAAGPCTPAFAKVGTAVQKYIVEKTSCSKDVVMTDNICSAIRSPQAQAIQTLMTVGTAALGQMNSASQTCSATSDLSKIGQAGATIWNLGCTAIKFKCDFSCAAAGKALVAVDAAANESSLCIKDLLAESSVLAASLAAHTAAVGNASTQMLALSSAQKPPVAASVASCEKHAASIAQIASQVLGLAMAAQQAKDCKEKLTANDGDGGSSGGGGGGVGGKPSAITTTQLCSDPKNATMQICKCNASATAEGCPGAIAKLTTTSSPSFKSTGNGSQMAGPDAAFKQGSNLSAAAKSALGINSDGTNNGSANSAGLGFNGGGTSGTDSNAAGAHGSANQKTDTAGSSKEKSKFNLGSFSSLGGAIGGFFGGSKKSGGSEKSSKDQIESAKRQIASEKVRSEISSASGRSNWDKVSTRYTESTSTFLGQ